MARLEARRQPRRILLRRSRVGTFKMMKKLSFAAVTIVACAAALLTGAPRSEAEPRPDPRELERFLLSLEAPVPPEQPALAKAERVAAAVDRSDPDRLAAPAERLLAR